MERNPKDFANYLKLTPKPNSGKPFSTSYIDWLNSYIQKLKNPITIQNVNENIKKWDQPTVARGLVTFLAWYFYGNIEKKSRDKIRNKVYVPPKRVLKQKYEKIILPEDVLKIIESCDDPKEKMVLRLLFNTGMRRGEIVSILMENIDFDNNRIIIVGKGNKQRMVYFGELLKKDLLFAKGKSGSLFLSLFPEYKNKEKGLEPKKIMQRRCYHVWYIVRKNGQKALGRVIHPHMMRFGFATDYINSGGEATKLQKIMGHSNLTTTLGYVEVAEKTVHEDYRKFHKEV